MVTLSPFLECIINSFSFAQMARYVLRLSLEAELSCEVEV